MTIVSKHARLVILAIVSCAIMAVAVGAGALGATAASSTFRIALVLPEFSTNSAILSVKDAADAEAKKLGNVQLITTGSSDGSVQAAAIEDAIASHVNAIVYVAIDPKTVTAALGQAVAAHIPVVCYLTCVTTIKNSAVVGFNTRTLGYDEGIWEAQTLKAAQRKHGGTPVLVTIDENNTQPILAALQAGRDAAIAAAGVHPQYFTSPPTLADPSTGLTDAANELTAHPRIDVMDCVVDSVALACIEAAKTAHRAGIPIVAGNGDCQNLEAVLKGQQAYDAIVFLNVGSAAALDDAVNILGGHSVKNSGVRFEGVDTATAKAILSGKEQAPAGLDTLARLQAARAGCK